MFLPKQWRMNSSQILKLSLALFLFGFSGKVAIAFEPEYDLLFPTYLEFSSGTQVKPFKEESGGIGGHAVVYIRGLCKDYSVTYPRVKVCDPNEKQLFPHDGVGISVDSQFRNVNWVAVPGYEFFMNGERSAGATVNEAEITRTNFRASELRAFEGVKFHPENLDPKLPPAEYRRKLIALCTATDFALTYGRTMTSHRVPIHAKHLADIADYLNGLNAPFLSGKANYQWSGLSNNCAHLSAKIFAIAGIRKAVPTSLPTREQILNLTIPSNGLITLQNGTNFRNIEARQIWKKDATLREAILKDGELPVGAGSLTGTFPVVTKNEIYATDLHHLTLMPKPFYDAPSAIWNTYISDHSPKYSKLYENLKMWRKKYKEALKSISNYRCRDSKCVDFMQKYEKILRAEISRTEENLTKVRP